MPRCKLGDRALVINSRVPANVGKIVEIVYDFGFCAVGDTYVFDGIQYEVEEEAYYWGIRSLGTDFVLVHALITHSTASTKDSNLRPLPPVSKLELEGAASR